MSTDIRRSIVKPVWNVLDDVEDLHSRGTRIRSGMTSLTNQGGVATSMGKDALNKWWMEDKRLSRRSG